LGREPTPQEAAAWAASGLDANTVTAAIASSSEYGYLRGSLGSMLDGFYRGLLGRAPEPGAVAFQRSQLPPHLQIVSVLTWAAQDAQAEPYFRAALDLWGQASGLTFREMPLGSQDVNIRVHTLQQPASVIQVGLGTLPNGTLAPTDAWIVYTSVVGDRGDPCFTAEHETGHCLGLTDGLGDGGQPVPFGNVMSYQPPPATRQDPIPLGPSDVHEIQARYGP
jgi:hypothetical protein